MQNVIPAEATTRQRLIQLLSDNALHSGRELAEELNLSRAAVWKALQELEKQGLSVQAVRGRGYRLPHPVEPLDAEMLTRHLAPDICTHISTLELHTHLDSTNTYLMKRARDGSGHSGHVCLADSQGSGRGRMGRHWVSPPGANVYLSLLWCYEDHTYLTGLSLAVGVAVARALIASNLPDVALKWPNDILWQDKKLGGILIEATGTAHGGCQVVIGLGINRYIPDDLAGEIDQSWVDLHQIQGQNSPSRHLLIARIINEVIPLLVHYPEQGLNTWLEEWKTLHPWTGRQVTLQQGDNIIRGTLEDISDQGLLILRSADGTVKEFGSGEVRLKP